MWYLALVSYMLLIIKHAVDSAFITIQSKYSNEPYIVISRDGDEALTFIGIGDYGMNIDLLLRLLFKVEVLL